MQNAAEEPATGFYGKAPSAGDFIGRGLPRQLTRRWDRWMELALPGAMAGGGGGSAWRFVAAPGVFGDDAVSGVFQLSQDRVGRRFPFLVASPGVLAGAADPWFDAAEALVLRSREGQLGPDALAERCEAMPAPLGPGPVPGGGAAVFWLGREARAPHAFATLAELANGGLTTLFAAGGPAEPVGRAEDDFDAEASAALLAAAPADLPAEPADSPLGDEGDLDRFLGLEPTAPAEAEETASAEPAEPETAAPPAEDDSTAPRILHTSLPDDADFGGEPAAAPTSMLPEDAVDTAPAQTQALPPLDDLLPPERADDTAAQTPPASPLGDTGAASPADEPSLDALFGLADPDEPGPSRR